jgi:asparagine synthase (glutamine-hydrolysing)
VTSRLEGFLSGGVDSSAIVAAMKSANERVSTWSIGSTEEDLEHEIVPDDLRYAREVGSLFGTDYHERILETNVLELLPKAFWHLEKPIADPAATSTYLICAEARREMPVMLSGMGGDEVFAGYPCHLAWRIARALGTLPTDSSGCSSMPCTRRASR